MLARDRGLSACGVLYLLVAWRYRIVDGRVEHEADYLLSKLEWKILS